MKRSPEYIQTKHRSLKHQTFAFSLSGCCARGFIHNVLDYLAEAAVVGAVKHPPSAELAGFPEKVKADKRTVAKRHPAKVLLWFSCLPTRGSEAAGGAQGCPGSAQALQLPAWRSQQPRAPARSAGGGQMGAIPGGDRAGQAEHQLGAVQPSPALQPVLPGPSHSWWLRYPPASVPGTSSQSSATKKNSKKPPWTRSLCDKCCAETHFQHDI